MAPESPSFIWYTTGWFKATQMKSYIHIHSKIEKACNTLTNCMGLLLWVCWDFTFDPVNCWIHCKQSRVYPDLSSHLQALYSSGMQRKNVRGKNMGVYIGHSHLVDTNVILRSELQQSVRKESLSHFLGFNGIFWHSFSIGFPLSNHYFMESKVRCFFLAHVSFCSILCWSNGRMMSFTPNQLAPRNPKRKVWQLDYTPWNTKFTPWKTNGERNLKIASKRKIIWTKPSFFEFHVSFQVCISENGWLEDDPFLLGQKALFSELLLLVSGRVKDVHVQT